MKVCSSLKEKRPFPVRPALALGSVESRRDQRLASDLQDSYAL